MANRVTRIDVELGTDRARQQMQKEIFEQPRAIADTLEGVEGIVPELFDGAGLHGEPGACWTATAPCSIFCPTPPTAPACASASPANTLRTTNGAP